MTNDLNYENLQAALKPYSLADICCALADKLFAEAEMHQKAGYQATAIELEKLAEIIGDLHVPGIPTVRETPLGRKSR